MPRSLFLAHEARQGVKALVGRDDRASVRSYALHMAVDRCLEAASQNGIFLRLERLATPARLSLIGLLMVLQVFQFEIVRGRAAVFFLHSDPMLLLLGARAHGGGLRRQALHEVLHRSVLVLEEYLMLKLSAPGLAIAPAFTNATCRVKDWRKVVTLLGSAFFPVCMRVARVMVLLVDD